MDLLSQSKSLSPEMLTVLMHFISLIGHNLLRVLYDIGHCAKCAGELWIENTQFAEEKLTV